jgi:MoxR-like ATPase
MTQALAKIQKIQDELNSILFEREEQIEAMLAALLSRNHVLLLGPPGTAKSMLAKLLCEAITEANYFQWLLTKFSTPEEIFGPISMKGLKEDEYRRVIDGKLPTAHVVLIDEIFKGNSAIQNSTLTALNEREFDNGTKRIPIPLLTCIGASNELPQGEELGALYDRFIVKFWVKPIEKDSNFIDLLCNNVHRAQSKKKRPEVKTKITLKELSQLQKEVEQVEFPREIAKEMREIHLVLRTKGVIASDRRWTQAVGVMQAHAFLRGEDKVTTDELEILANILWEKPEDRAAIYKEVAKRSNPLNVKAVEFRDSAEEVYEEWKNNKSNDSKALQANGTLKDIIQNIKDEMKDRPDRKTKKLHETLDYVEGLRREIVTSLGV